MEKAWLWWRHWVLNRSWNYLISTPSVIWDHKFSLLFKPVKIGFSVIWYQKCHNWYIYLEEIHHFPLQVGGETKTTRKIAIAGHPTFRSWKYKILVLVIKNMDKILILNVHKSGNDMGHMRILCTIFITFV